MELETILISDIDNTGRSRVDMKDIEGLSLSIADKGLIQPITVQPHPDSPDETPYSFKLLAGGRRLEAVRLLDTKFISAVVREGDDEIDALEIEMIENLQREDFTWYEKCELTYKINEEMKRKYKNQVREDGTHKQWSKRETAKLIGKDHAGVLRKLELYDWAEMLPEIKSAPSELIAVERIRKLEEEMALLALHKDQMEVINNEVESVDRSTSQGEAGDTHYQSAEEQGKANRAKFLKRAYHSFQVGDAFKGMEETTEMHKGGKLPPIRFAEVDPPYGIDIIEQKKGEGEGRDEYNEIVSTDYEEFLHKLCSHLYDVLAKDSHMVFWYGHEWYETVTKIIGEAGFNFDKIPCVWVKPAGQTNSPDRYLARAYEPFIYAWKGDPIINRRGRLNVFNHGGVGGSTRFHPTQRPIRLMADIYETFTFPGEVCIIPFLGSGASLLGAYRNGNLAFGWDLSEDYKKRYLALAELDFLEYHSGKQDKTPTREERHETEISESNA